MVKNLLHFPKGRNKSAFQLIHSFSANGLAYWLVNCVLFSLPRPPTWEIVLHPFCYLPLFFTIQNHKAVQCNMFLTQILINGLMWEKSKLLLIMLGNLPTVKLMYIFWNMTFIRKQFQVTKKKMVIKKFCVWQTGDVN